MNAVLDNSTFELVCTKDDILPNTGVAALVAGEPVAIFRVGEASFYAISNTDPRTGANVLSRGIIGSIGDKIVVASPIYKQHIDLKTGECLEDASLSVRCFEVCVTSDHAVLVR